MPSADCVPCGANLRCDWITDPNHLDWPSWQQCVPADSPANTIPTRTTSRAPTSVPTQSPKTPTVRPLVHPLAKYRALPEAWRWLEMQLDYDPNHPTWDSWQQCVNINDPDQTPKPNQNPAKVELWQQCGGKVYKGANACTSGNKCVSLNDWYSQCQPDSRH